MSNSSYVFKIIIGGAGGVGKTTLLHRYLHDVFLPNSTMTIGVAFHTKEIIIETTRKRIKFSLWDLGGQQRFRFLQSSYSAGAKAGIVFFDMTRLDTIDQVKEWVSMFRAQGDPNMPIVLGGTKLDVVDADMIEETNKYAMEVATKLGLTGYFPTSSKAGMNVGEIFTHLIDELIKRSELAKDHAGKAITR